MDLFRYFRNNKSLDEMINELNKNLKNFGFEPYTSNFTTSEETWLDENGAEWVKSSFKTNDGNIMVVTMSSNHTNDGLSNSANINQLEKELNKAVESQNFEMAVELRDKIKHLKSEVKNLKSLEKELEIAIKNQNFEKCIELRDKIKNLKTK